MLPRLLSAQQRINRNIVECKVANIANALHTTPVLIETLWNVKYAAPLRSDENAIVLIETLWNVKLSTRIRLVTALSCINRNIVECKVS